MIFYGSAVDPLISCLDIWLLFQIYILICIYICLQIEYCYLIFYHLQFTQLFWSPVVGRPSIHPSFWYLLFTFSSSSPESILAQSIFGWRGFKFVQMKGHTLFQGKIITKYRKYFNLMLISSAPKPLCHSQSNLAQSILGWRIFSFKQNKDNSIFKQEIMPFFSHNQCYGIVLSCVNVFIGWKCFSGERCDPSASFF